MGYKAVASPDDPLSQSTSSTPMVFIESNQAGAVVQQ